MNRAAVATLVVAATLGAGCGATTVDTSVTTAPGGSVAPVTTVPIPTDAGLDVLLPLLVDEMSGLDEQIVDNDGDESTLARIDAIWVVAAPQVRDQLPDSLFGFEQAIALAHSGVERRRPADASKGYKIAQDLVGDALAG